MSKNKFRVWSKKDKEYVNLEEAGYRDLPLRVLLDDDGELKVLVYAYDFDGQAE